MSARVPELEHLARDVREDGYRRAAVLGMGGSSLAPELFSRVFGWAGGAGGSGAASADGLELRILDSTHPDVVRGFRSWASEQRTLFLVSSKSGSTTEPNAFQAAMGEIAPALDFIAITDPGSSLADLARAQEFRAIVDRAGPTSAAATPRSASSASCRRRSTASTSAGCWSARGAWPMPAAPRTRPSNPGLRLGALHRRGRARRPRQAHDPHRRAPRRRSATGPSSSSPSRPARRAWASCRSSASRARDPDAYADDRCFVRIRLAGEHEPELDALADALEARGHPVERLDLADPLDIGAEFVRWEVATAVAGIVLGIDPFDQPNVQESKDATTALLETFRERGALPQPMPLVSEPGVAVSADPSAIGDAPVSVDGAVSQLLGLARPGIDYVAILAYLPQDRDVEARLQAIRARIGAATGAATTLGFGPRFLHSTGQLHKGGPDTGVFLQLTAEPSKDLPIPGWEESFGTLIAAQALGDLASLQKRGRRAMRLHFDDADAGLARLEAMVGAALSV